MNNAFTILQAGNFPAAALAPMVGFSGTSIFLAVALPLRSVAPGEIFRHVAWMREIRMQSPYPSKLSTTVRFRVDYGTGTFAVYIANLEDRIPVAPHPTEHRDRLL